MFNSILGFWKGKDFLTQVLDDFKSMLDSAESMFTLVCDSLIYGNQNESLREQIYEIDRN